jgi:hypothetical protein
VNLLRSRFFILCIEKATMAGYETSRARPFAISGGHPEAPDPIEGIIELWVAKWAIKHWFPHVRKSLAGLAVRGYLEMRRTADGVVFHRRN